VTISTLHLERREMMGQITINIYGSFEPFYRKDFIATDGGHADCVALAIEFLAGTVLPRAIEQDHELHEEGNKPVKGFGYRDEV